MKQGFATPQAIAIRRIVAIFAVFCGLLRVEAGLTWDIGIGEDATITEGSGQWDSASENWNNGAESVPYTAGSEVIFGSGASGTTAFKVSYEEGLTAKSLRFRSGATYEIETTTGKVISLVTGEITVEDGVTAILDATIARAAGIQKLGNGTLELANGNAFFQASISGNPDVLTTVSAGELRLNASASPVQGLVIENTGMIKLLTASQIRDAGTVTLNNGGTLDIGGFDERVNTLNVNSGTISGSGRLIVDDAINLGAGTISAKIEGTLTKNKAGTTILTGNNTGLSGTVAVQLGTLQVGNGGASGSLDDNNVSVSADATLAFNRGDTALNVVNNISGAGQVEINSASGAKVTLTPANENTYSGGTTLTSGTLVVGSDKALPAGREVRFNGGALELNNKNLSGGSALGNLALQGDSRIILDMAGGSVSLTFSSATYEGGFLKILGWTPTGNDNGNWGQPGIGDRIFISGGIGAVGPGFLSNVQFYSDLEGTMQIGQGAMLLEGNELAPAPEPTNIALAIFGGAFVLRVLRRRLPEFLARTVRTSARAGGDSDSAARLVRRRL